MKSISTVAFKPVCFDLALILTTNTKCMHTCVNVSVRVCLDFNRDFSAGSSDLRDNRTCLISRIRTLSNSTEVKIFEVFKLFAYFLINIHFYWIYILCFSTTLFRNSLKICHVFLCKHLENIWKAIPTLTWTEFTKHSSFCTLILKTNKQTTWEINAAIDGP